MSQITLTVIDAGRAIHGRPHGSFADRVVAALAAEPETIEELVEALARFDPGERDFFLHFETGVCDEPFDAGVCIVDLTARLVAARSSYSTPGPEGDVPFREDGRATDIRVRYRVSDDWSFSDDVASWERLAQERRRERRIEPSIDARPVLYGEVGPFIVKECLAARGKTAASDRWTPPAGWAPHELPERAEPDGEFSADDAVAEIHARWLMNPRANLAGKTPREVLLEKRQFLDADLQARCEQWSQTKRCPVGLSPASAAFRLGGFGSHECILYHYLVRHLIRQCWDRAVGPDAAERPDADKEATRVAGDLERWMNAPQEEDLCGWSPSLAIERERMRLPMVASGENATIDDDCPLCRMMADAGPMFWHLDGYDLDEDFPFSSEPSRELWEKDQRDRKARDAQWEEQWAAEERKRKELGLEDDQPFWDELNTDEDGDYDDE